jgi:hypothetical protein
VHKFKWRQNAQTSKSHADQLYGTVESRLMPLVAMASATVQPPSTEPPTALTNQRKRPPTTDECAAPLVHAKHAHVENEGSNNDNDEAKAVGQQHDRSDDSSVSGSGDGRVL